MNTLTHVILYTLLISTSVISTIGGRQTNSAYTPQKFEQLAAFDEVSESCALEEKGECFEIKDEKICIYNTKTNQNFYMPLEEYVICVMLAEAPSWYNKEALKAIAVAVRTYAVCKAQTPSHTGGASLCTSPSHCQAFYTFEEAVGLWGEKSATRAYELVKEAVLETKSQILLYGSDPILAMYHASSYLHTKSLEEVCGGGKDYLQSVAVPFENKETSRTFEKLFSFGQCKDIISTELGVTLSDNFSITAEWSDGRCVRMLVVCDGLEAKISCDRVRALFSLSSSNFQIEKTSEGYLFKSYGFGHGIGLSQEGANIMALDGSTYEKILSHYYINTNLGKLKIVE